MICTQCNGRGTITVSQTCPTCGGAGYVERSQTCSTCSGSGWVSGGNCWTCGGSGTVNDETCGSCNGSGKAPDVRCGECNGSGSVTVREDCPATVDVEQSCPTCGGSGQVADPAPVGGGSEASGDGEGDDEAAGKKAPLGYCTLVYETEGDPMSQTMPQPMTSKACDRLAEEQSKTVPRCIDHKWRQI